MVYCIECGVGLPADAKFCARCGTPVIRVEHDHEGTGRVEWPPPPTTTPAGYAAELAHTAESAEVPAHGSERITERFSAPDESFGEIFTVEEPPHSDRRTTIGLVIICAVVVAAVALLTTYLLFGRGSGGPSAAASSPAISSAPAASPEAAESAEPTPAPSSEPVVAPSPSPTVASPSPSPTAPPSAATLVAALGPLFDSSRTGQQQLHNFAAAGPACGSTMRNYQAAIEQVISNRTTLLAQLNGIDFSGVPGGADLKKKLAAVWETSRADAQEFLAAVKADQQGNAATCQAHVNTGIGDANAAAINAKRLFLNAWNAIAPTQPGMPPLGSGSL